MRKMLQQMGKCDQCLLNSKDHPNKYRRLLSPCRVCGAMTHFSITCDGNEHPGSWVIKMFKPNNNSTNPNTKTVTQTQNTHWHKTTALVCTSNSFFGIQSSMTMDNCELTTHALFNNSFPHRNREISISWELYRTLKNIETPLIHMGSRDEKDASTNG